MVELTLFIVRYLYLLSLANRPIMSALVRVKCRLIECQKASYPTLSARRFSFRTVGTCARSLLKCVYLLRAESTQLQSIDTTSTLSLQCNQANQNETTTTKVPSESSNLYTSTNVIPGLGGVTWFQWYKKISRCLGRSRKRNI